ncbi:MAG: phage tail protein, partial [Planctomycetota bacterium]
VAIKLDSLEYDFNENNTEGSTTLGSPVLHSKMTITPVDADEDYLLVHSSETRASSATYQVRSQIHIPGSTEVYIHNFREPYTAATGKFIDSGFWPVIGISAAADVESYYYDESSGTAYKKNVHLAALRLNDFLSYTCTTYIGEMSDDSNNPVTLASVDITPGFAQNYLVMASCKVGTSLVNNYATAWLDIDGVTYDYMNYNVLEDLNDRVTFVGMRRVNLDTSQHTLSLKFSSTGGVFTRAANGSIIAIPLDHAVPEYTNKSNVVDICTAANVPYMENSATTFTDRTNESITVYVDPNGNPAGTSVELWYAIGDSGGNTAALAKWNGTLTSGYSWDVTGLEANTSYWFQARAENWRGCFTDFCNITVWSTLPGVPVLSCIDCASDSLTWAWTSNGGDGFYLYDNETDLPVIVDIPGTETGTIETGLDPNTTYSRYLKAYFSGNALSYYYNENLPGTSTTLTTFQDVCTLSLSGTPEGNYFIIATMQVASSTSTDIRSEFQLIDESSNVVGIKNIWTDTFFFSFMASESRYLDGTGSPEYKLQARSVNNGYDTDARNAAIIAVKLPSNNFNALDNSTDGDTLSLTYDNHSVMTVTPPGSNDDYMLIHTSNLNHTSTSYPSHSRLRRLTPTERTFTEGACEPRSVSSWICQGGFGMLKDISSDIVLAHQYHRDVSGTAHSKNVHIAAVRLNETVWQSYSENSFEGEQTTTGTTDKTALEISFNAPKPQKYLIMTSASIGSDTTGPGPHGWWEHECASEITEHDHMYYGLVEDMNDRMTFAGIRRLDLAAGDHTIRIEYKHQIGTSDAKIGNPSIIVLPLEGSMKEFTDPSNIVDTCTAALVPYMENSATTFTDRTNTSITVYVDPNGNPADTGIELWYAIGDETGNTAALAKWNGTLTSGYSWNVTSLEANTSYWFQARAENWRGCFTDFCNITVWSTLPGVPVLSCIDCASDSLTWAWTSNGGSAYEIFDNDTDVVVVSGIDGDATYTIETGLSPNNTYNRYMKAIVGVPLTYYYAEYLNDVSTTSSVTWENVCTLQLSEPVAGDYQIIAVMQVKDGTNLGQRGYARFVKDDTDTLHIILDETDDKYHSFISTETLSASGSDDYKYQLQIMSAWSGEPINASNSSIIAIKLPASGCYTIDNVTLDSTTSTSFVNHSLLTVSSSGPSDDFWIIHSANFKSNSQFGDPVSSRLFDLTGSNELTYSQRDEYSDTSEAFTQGGFSTIKGISSDVTLAAQYSGYTSTTGYQNNTHIAAIRLNSFLWNGYGDNSLYATEQSTQDTNGVVAVTKTFDVTAPQYYLIMGSCAIGHSSTSDWPSAWLEHDCVSGTTNLGQMDCLERDLPTERGSFAAMRRMYLAAGNHTIRIKFSTSNGATFAFVRCPSVIAVPLEGIMPEYTDKSNVVDISTAAAIPFMDNSNTTFKDQANDSITVQVGLNGNPTGTTVELEYAFGDETGPIGPWIPAGSLTSGYTWAVDNSGQGLHPNTSYWFKSRAENWRGCLTDYCNVTVWSTLPGGPTDFACIDCSSTTLTWMWTNNGGDGFVIYNASDSSIVISDIDADATWTVETGLDPNTSYSRYIKSFSNSSLTYFYSEELDYVQVESSNYENVCVLELVKPSSGQYLVIASTQAESEGASEPIGLRMRHHDGASWSVVHNSIFNPYQKYQSFMSADIFTADGSTDYAYALQLRNETSFYYARAQNSSIVAIRLPTSNYNVLENLTEDFTSSETPVVHSTMTVTPPDASDYLLVHAASFRSNSGAYTCRSAFDVPSPNAVYSTIWRQPSSTYRYHDGGFWPWNGLSVDTDVEHFYWQPGTTTNGCFKKDTRISAFRLSDEVWSGYACNSYTGNMATNNNVGVDLVSLTFTPSKTQDYLILASCVMGYEEVGRVVNSNWGAAWLEVDGASYDRMRFDEGDDEYRAPFTAIRRVNLDTLSHTIKIRIRSSNLGNDVYGSNAAIIVLPLSGQAVQYSDPSNTVDTCTAAAIPFMDNTTATFTDQTNDSITVVVGPNGNPAGTSIELWYAIGDENGNTAVLTKWNGTLTSGYMWELTGLEANTSYWFQARAENWRGCFTDFCNITVWSTEPGPPILSCIDCTSVSLTWEWTDTGGEGFTLFDNDTGLPVVSDIPGSVTTTIETGLDPNTTYSRYIRAFLTRDLAYYYNESLTQQTSTVDTFWNACVLNMTYASAGDYLVTATLQGSSHTGTGDPKSEFRLVDTSSTVIGLQNVSTNDGVPAQFFSFMASEVLSHPGGSTPVYMLQARSLTSGQTTYVQNAAIIAIKLMGGNYHYIDNSTEGSINSNQWTNHSILTVTPVESGDNYWVINNSNFRHSNSLQYEGYSRLYRFDTAGPINEDRRIFEGGNTEWYIQGGFGLLSGISSEVTLADQYHSYSSGYTMYQKNVHIAAVRLNDSTWDGYNGTWYNGQVQTGSTVTAGVTAVTCTFDVTEAQDYLIMASGGLGTSNIAVYPTAWWEHIDPNPTTTQYDRMKIDDVATIVGRIKFAAIRKLNLAVGTHTIRIQFFSSSGGTNVYINYPTVIAIPLEGSGLDYTDPSNVVDTCTAANIP